MKSIKYHIQSIIEVFKQLSKGRFLLYFIPGLIVTLLYFWLSTTMENATESSSSWIARIPLIGTFIDQGFNATINVVQFIFNQIYIFFIIIILSPFNTHLSEKLDTQVTGRKFENGFGRIINDLIRMIFIVMIAVLLEFGILAAWWFISWIFGINEVIYTLFSFIMASFFFGFSFYDYSLERYNVTILGSLGFAFGNPLLLILTGALFQGIYYFPYTSGIPFIGIYLAPVLLTMISTIVYLYHIKKLTVPSLREPYTEKMLDNE